MGLAEDIIKLTKLKAKHAHEDLKKYVKEQLEKEKKKEKKHQKHNDPE